MQAASEPACVTRDTALTEGTDVRPNRKAGTAAILARTPLFATCANRRAVHPLTDGRPAESPAFRSPRVRAAARGRNDPWSRLECATSLLAEIGSDLLFASRRCLAGPVGRRRPTRRLVPYRLICSPALAEIVGDGRPWTVLMISLLSMPWGRCS
jgi:hypothetical protein